MTRKTFFNKGIYLNTLKRFWVGSCMYFLLMLLISGVWAWSDSYNLDNYHFAESCFMSFFTAPVVAILVYKYIHSKKNSIFIHSLPVTRTENYISTLLGAVTLMTLPVILTGLIFMAASGRAEQSIYWTFYTVICNFAVFSVATLSASLTGASWVSVPVYIGLSCAGAFISSYEDLLMDKFATGYTDGGSIIGQTADKCSMYYIFAKMIDFFEDTSKLNWKYVSICIAAALVLYAISFFLYKKRHMEKCEDASAYKAFNHVLKYVTTIVAAWLAFSLFDMEDNISVFLAGTLILTVVAYFGTEMIIKKSLKVFGCYKGYVAFVLCYAGVLLFFAFTSIFGYETYIPPMEDIESIKINAGYSEYNDFSDAECMALAMGFHEEIIESECENIYRERATMGDRFSYTYKLKDGTEIKRTYVIGYKKGKEYMESLYSLNTFKVSAEKIFNIDPESVYDIDILKYPYDNTLNREDYAELIECIKADILENSYSDLYPDEVEVYSDRGEALSTKCVIIIYYEADNKKISITENEFLSIINVKYYLTPHYTKTLEFLESKGFTGIRSFIG